MVSLLLAVPIVAGLLAMAIPWHVPRRVLLVATALAHAGLATACVAQTPGTVLNGWIAIDAIAAVFLLITSFVFLMVSIYTVGYLREKAAAYRTRRTTSRPLRIRRKRFFRAVTCCFWGP